MLASRPVEIVCGAIGVFLLGVVIYAGLTGVEVPEANFASLFVYIAFWVGLVPLSVLFGDVFRAFNPWRAIGRAAAWVARKLTRGELPAPLEYPRWLGRWPAAAGLLAFTALELVAADGDKPEPVAIGALVYSALTFIAMALYGVERWIDRGEAFSVYFNLFARMSPVETRDGVVGLRRPLSGLPPLELLPGTVALLAVMIGSVTFDGASEAPLWSGDLARHRRASSGTSGLAPQRAFELAFLVGLVGAVTLIAGFYRLGIQGAKSVGGGFSASRLANEFVHSLVPIALAYVAAHYFTLLLFDGQRLFYAISDPLGQGDDLFGTAGTEPDFGLIGANAIWYFQVGFVVAGHVAALVLAHDRALALYDDAKLAVRSQYWMLAIMVGFTSLALWLLSQANA